MQISEKGLQAIIAFEGMELCAYRCPAGIWTIGVGHTCEVDGVIPLLQIRSKTHKLAMLILFFSCQVMSDSATPWIVARQASLFMGFSRQKYWNGYAISFSRGSSQIRNQT